MQAIRAAPSVVVTGALATCALLVWMWWLSV